MGGAERATGYFITFEGVEGSGKSTQRALLADRLRAEGFAVIELREPGDTPLGERLRALLLGAPAAAPAPAAELCLFLAARAQLCAQVIRGALDEGRVVLCDRFADSTTAYQGFGRGFDLTLIHQLNRLVTAGVWPDLTVLLDLDPAAGLARRAAGAGAAAGDGLDRFERESLDFHRRVRKGYLELARAEPARFLILDALEESAAIATQIWAHVRPRLPQAAPAPAATASPSVGAAVSLPSPSPDGGEGAGEGGQRP